VSERTAATPWPLYWPDGWPRTERYKRAPSRFNRQGLTVYGACQDVLAELKRLRAGNAPILSSNLRVKPNGMAYAGQRIPDDPGVSVWFVLRGEPRVLACDRWQRVEENFRAVALHIGAIRGMDRWGVGSIEQAFAGFVALPERAGGTPWWDVLEYDGEPDNIASLTREEVEKRFRELAHKYHPDKGGTLEEWHRLQDARAQALAGRRA